MSVEVRVLTGVVLTSLAGAAIFYIAVDEVRKDMSGGNEEPIIIGLAIAVIIGIGIVCLMDALKNKLK